MSQPAAGRIAMPLRRAVARPTGDAAGDLDPTEVRTGTVHLAARGLSRTAASLLDPKPVRTWLMTSVGAPGAAVAAVVPLRKAGALLPQLALARRVERTRRRKGSGPGRRRARGWPRRGSCAVPSC